MNEHQKISRKGGKAGRGAAKARTSEQASAAAQARWATVAENKALKDHVDALIRAGNAVAREAFERGAISQVEAWDAAVSSLPNVGSEPPRSNT